MAPRANLLPHNPPQPGGPSFQRRWDPALGGSTRGWGCLGPPYGPPVNLNKLGFHCLWHNGPQICWQVASVHTQMCNQHNVWLRGAGFTCSMQNSVFDKLATPARNVEGNGYSGHSQCSPEIEKEKGRKRRR